MSGDDRPRVAPRGGGAEEGSVRLVLAGGTDRRLAGSLEEAYPREGCGLLLGRVDGDDRVVEEVRAAANRWEGRDDRYLVDPETLRRAVDEEAAGGPRVLGFYHSHPDAEPVPSATDRELAWPWYVYLIVPVRDGRAGTGRAWKLAEDEDGWAERPVLGGTTRRAIGRAPDPGREDRDGNGGDRDASTPGA